MTRAEYVIKKACEDVKVYKSIIKGVKRRIKKASIYERYELTNEQNFFIIKNKNFDSVIKKDLEKKYPFLIFEISTFYSLIRWHLKEKQ